MITFEILRIIDEILLLVFINQEYREIHDYNHENLSMLRGKYPNGVITVDERE